MYSKRQIFFLCIVLILLAQTFHAYAVPIVPIQPRIRIIITPDHRNYTYIQGERVIFRIEIFDRGRYIDIQQNLLQAVFISPRDQNIVRMRRRARGIYNYESPILTEAGQQNYNLTVRVIGSQRRILNRLIGSNILAEASCTISVTQDIIPPQISNIVINEGDFTLNQLIHITLQVEEAHSMIISEDSNFNGAEWEAFTVNKGFILSPDFERKNIYFKFRDLFGNETGVIARSIRLLSQAKPESQGPVRVNGRQLFVNNESYVIKGVTYQPTPIGGMPGNPDDIYTAEDCGRDFSLLRDMGCNTIRTYSKVNQTLLDKTEEYGLKVCAGFWIQIDPWTDLSEPLIRNNLKSEFRDYINQFKDHPALLMWIIGNEENHRYSGDIRDWYTLVNEMAIISYDIEDVNYHPVAIVNGDINNIGESNILADDDSLNYVDIWGINVYVGYSFTENPLYPDYFSEYAQLSNKPLWISEYGIDAWDNAHNVESQKRQSAWDLNNWNEIESNSSVCIGATLMSYSDEWWKAGTPDLHNNEGYDTNNMPHPDSHPDRFSNEEWWGIVAIEDNGVNPDIVIPRLVYYTLKRRWSGPEAPIIIEDFNGLSNLPSGTFSSNGSCSYSYNADEQNISISYDVTNADSYSGYYILLNDFSAHPYENISFFVKGQDGNEIVKIGLRDTSGNEAKINIPEYLSSSITDSWQRVIIPLSSFSVDIGHLDNLSISFESAIASNSGTIFIDDIGFGPELPPLIITNYNSTLEHQQNALGSIPWIHQIGSSQISYELNPSYGMAVTYTVSGGTYCRLGLGVNHIDVSSFETLSLLVKGDAGGEVFHVYLEDFWNNRAFAEVNGISTDWQAINIPVNIFLFNGVDITNLINLEIVFEWEDRSGIVYIDDIKFTD